LLLLLLLLLLVVAVVVELGGGDGGGGGCHLLVGWDVVVVVGDGEEGLRVGCSLFTHMVCFPHVM
jgi:hypothetical protein